MRLLDTPCYFVTKRSRVALPGEQNRLMVVQEMSEDFEAFGDAGPIGFAAESDADCLRNGGVGGSEPMGSGDEDPVVFAEAFGVFRSEV